MYVSVTADSVKAMSTPGGSGVELRFYRNGSEAGALVVYLPTAGEARRIVDVLNATATLEEVAQ
jgi:hypothetical protein